MRQTTTEDTALKVALRNAGMTQYGLAAKIGVATNTVWQWAAGRASLPAERAVQIAGVLGVPASQFASMLSDRGRVVRLGGGEPKTMLSWLVRNTLGGDGDNFRPLVERMATAAGVSVFELRDWLEGWAPIPGDAIHAWAGLFPGFNPKVLCFEVLSEANESVPVRELIGQIYSTRGSLHTFDAVAELVADAKAAFEGSDAYYETVAEALDNGKPTSEFLMEQARRFHYGK